MSWIVPQAPCWVQLGSYTYDKESPTEEPLYMEAVVLQGALSEKEDVLVQILLNQEKRSIPQAKISPRQFNPEEIETFADMVTMRILNEAEILNNTFVRFRRDEIYTYIGPTLLCMNPYKPMKIYESIVIQKVQKEVSAGPTFELNSVQPHVFAVSGLAFKQLMNSEKKQAIVISGESGAGKTENAKYAMRFLTSLSESRSKTVNKLRRGGIQLQEAIQVEKSTIEDKILSCNPIMESFGNAKTVRNDNSSRFGKYVRILVEGTHIVGATINNYLLEKSRVVSQQKGERNYHVFYLMLFGLPPGELAAMGLISSPIDSVKMEDFPYLTYQKGELSQNFLKGYEELQEGFVKTGFVQYEVKSLFNILAAILHLGSVQFDDSKFDENSTPCSIKSPIKLQMVAQLLGTNYQSLEKSLLLKTRTTPTATIESPIKLIECDAKRDAFAKFLYDKIFVWLVTRLNSSISIPGKEYVFNTQLINYIKEKSIGLLDIFGFENFASNSFEQLCINYTNERLQQLYVNYVFKREKQEFVDDGLQEYLSTLTFSDNQAIVQLLDGQMSLFCLLDEECLLKNGNDEAFLGKAQKAQAKHPNFQTSAAKKTFTILHTQSHVVYQAVNFVAKNRDETNKELEDAVSSSSNQIITQIFAKQNVKQSKTLGAHFRKEMAMLMTELESCEVHFVRCIKPNELKKRDFFIWNYVFQQIKYLGVLDSISVRKQTYPHRLEYVNFYSQYREIEPNLARKHGSLEHLVLKKADFRFLVQNFLTIVFPKQEPQYLLYGQKRVYLKREYMSVLDEKMLERFKLKCISARMILRYYRIYKFRKSISANLKHLLKAMRLLKKRLRKEYWKRQRIRMKALLKVVKQIKRKMQEKGYVAIRIAVQKKIKTQQTKKRKIPDGVNKLKKILLKRGYFTLKQAWEFNQFKQTLQTESHQSIQQQEDQNKISKTFNEIDDRNDKSDLIELQKQKAKQTKYTNLMNSKIQEETEEDPKIDYEAINAQSIVQNLRNNELSDKAKKILEERHVNQPVDKQTTFFSRKANYQTSDPSKDYKTQQIPYMTLGVKDEKSDQLPDIFNLPFEEALIDKTNFFLVTLKVIGNKSIQSDSAPFSVDRLFRFSDLSPNFIKNLSNFDLLSWSQSRVQPRTSFFGFQLSLEKIISYQDSNLRLPLLYHKSPYEDKRACELFKKILYLQKELYSVKISSIMIDLVNECLQASETFKDEIFLQLIKQINNNKKKDQLLRTLQLLTILSHVAVPSQQLCMCIMNFLIQKQGSTKDIDEEMFYSYVFVRFTRKVKELAIKPMQYGKLPSIPPNYQIVSLMTQRQVWAPVFICTGGTVVVWVETYETVGQLKTKALEKMGVNIKRVPLDFFGIFEILNNQSDLLERIVPDTQNVWQMLARWDEERQIYTRLKSKESLPVFILMLKIIYPYRYTINDFFSQQLVFSQTFYDLFTGKFCPNDADIDEMVYILNRTKGLTLNVTQCLPYLPKNKFNQKFVKYLDGKKDDQPLLNLEESQGRFLTIANSYPQCMCIYFRIKYCLNRQFINDQPIYLALKPFKVIIIKDQLHIPLAIYSYQQIIKWGVNNQYVVMHTDDGDFHLCETPQADAIGKYMQDCAIIYSKIKEIQQKQQNHQRLLISRQSTLPHYTSNDFSINHSYLKKDASLYDTKRFEQIEKIDRCEILETLPDQELQASLIPQKKFRESDQPQLKKTRILKKKM